MSRMFKSINRTWNVFVGCNWDCTYCNARKAALTRFKHIDRYKDGFHPHLVESELNKNTFKPGEFIFVAYMGDISFASHNELNRIIDVIEKFPDTRFLLQTKNPSRFFYNCPPQFPSNIIFGTTIETNRDKKYSKAPSPHDRYVALSRIIAPRFISIEPIMDFDLDILTSWIDQLHPEIVEIGADNYHNNLLEPTPYKVESLIYGLKSVGIKIVEKDGLERLKSPPELASAKKRGNNP